MKNELLILDPQNSSSVLEPLTALDVFFSSPARWVPELRDQSIDGICCLPSAGLRAVLGVWAQQRNLNFRIATGGAEWFSAIGAVILFEPKTQRERLELFSAFGVPVIRFDLALGTFVEEQHGLSAPEVLSLTSPNESRNLQSAKEV